MDYRDLVVEAEHFRLQAMRRRIAHLLRQVHRHGRLRPDAEKLLICSVRRSSRWAELKLERLRFAAEVTVAAEEFEVVYRALDQHCCNLETWLRRQAS